MVKRIYWALQYAVLTIKHKWFVLLASRRVGGIPFWQALAHDMSKFSLAELPHYGRQFFGDKREPDRFAEAWLHHQNSNPHHWEYWIPRTEHNRKKASMKAAGPMPMPERYVREMVADWMGASRAYTGSWDMVDWLEKNLPRMDLHPVTVERLWFLLLDAEWNPDKANRVLAALRKAFERAVTLVAE